MLLLQCCSIFSCCSLLQPAAAYSSLLQQLQHATTASSTTAAAAFQTISWFLLFFVSFIMDFNVKRQVTFERLAFLRTAKYDFHRLGPD
jgi:hypothetical protein